ncbi:UDP-glucose:undecaprenyl-phosphate glucose-1-phosphate transferase [Pseudidiomarina piscicola]|uniref:UDP-glucose:undecaprenyl-phosphate glucose-1-phosphate transferase n=1 Tax=Pseudidiomarina piscicola TaxID=2614830 RepID=A0A6S6WNZ8_9GAMM|nr:sugar transferase [Pseudidiomarina piscicola]CAB0151223.1 UDP-glucose:undecaprenyl-phosphate glucose-1-phosphate transferase [Pseudidiomarina piscicola]VZT40729.1 UDP-glucose:undecaprenyl-phosphate glucose-1-phosphate transferase [Pseudomonas aeruginosa]
MQKNSFYQRHGKRFLDLLIVVCATLALSPFLIAIALFIKVFDSGPIIFKQKRIGRHGELFDFYKFRSMPVNTGDLPSDRVGEVQLTWIGKLIRRTNIDELPQLINVLKGDMSIVGPRPPIPAQTELAELRRKSGALECRPGLTGLAQVSSFDGMSVSEKASFDEQYSESVTLWRDASIILRTFVYLLKPPPVY